MISRDVEDCLKKELVGLFGHLNMMRRELASLHRADSANFDTMTDTLDAIVENTEAASNTILESVEEIDAIVSQMRRDGDAARNSVCDQITVRINQVFEACSFQDLTGQRITRVVKSLAFVEARVNSMVRMWGKDELARVVGDIALDQEGVKPDKDLDLLHGPQRASEAITQADIDKLFS
jgi:chemotaxis protein CheZ